VGWGGGGELFLSIQNRNKVVGEFWTYSPFMKDTVNGINGY